MFSHRTHAQARSQRACTRTHALTLCHSFFADDLLERVRLLLETSKKVVSPPYTPATIGQKAIDELNAVRRFITFKPIGDTGAFLTANQQKSLSKANNEYELVAMLTPFLSHWLTSDFRILVNSETKPWINVAPEQGSKFNQKPDLFIAPYYAIEAKKAPVFSTGKNIDLPDLLDSVKRANPGLVDFVYGVPSVRCCKFSTWYDSVVPIAAKLVFSPLALGETINYTYWLSQSDEQSFSRAMLVTSTEFFLIDSVRGAAFSITKGAWTDFGSGPRIRAHFDFDSRWSRCIREICVQSQLTPVHFLGAGSTGRVVEVRDSSGHHYALKIVLPESIVSLQKERAYMAELISGNTLACLPDSISPVVYFEEEKGRAGGAGVLISPVGRPLLSSRVLSLYDIFFALLVCLFDLHVHLVLHGDPRIDNWAARLSTFKRSTRARASSPPQLELDEVYAQRLQAGSQSDVDAKEDVGPLSQPSSSSSLSSSSSSSSSSLSSSSSSLGSQSAQDCLISPQSSQDCLSSPQSYFLFDFIGSRPLLSTHFDSGRLDGFECDLRLFVGSLVGQKIETLTQKSQNTFHTLAVEYISCVVAFRRASAVQSGFARSLPDLLKSFSGEVAKKLFVFANEVRTPVASKHADDEEDFFN
jgi:hypothetical protein